MKIVNRFSGSQKFTQCVVGVLVLVGSLSARGADLLEVYHQAQSNDPTFEAARYAYEAAQEKIP